MLDVAVVGSGPAGTALGSACVDLGLTAALLDPAPHRPWPATYGAWADELPADLPPTAVASRPVAVRAFATSSHLIERDYLVLDNVGLRDHLDRAGLARHRGAAVAIAHTRSGSTVRLADGTVLPARLVVDARGGRPARSSPTRRPVAEQTAFGVVVPAAAAAGLVAPGEAVFMDWRPAPGARADWPTFLYALPLGRGEVLLEETSLARRPGLPLDELRQRLLARLAAGGVDVAGRRVERVRFAMDQPLPRPHRVLPFGAASGLVNPATGYSVAAALRLAPLVAAAVSAALPAGPVAAVSAGWRAQWPPAARIVHALRRKGLRVLLGLTPAQVPEFFELFFSLPADLQARYLTGRADVTGTAGAMAALFGAAPWPLRTRMVGQFPRYATFALHDPTTCN